VPDKKLQWGYGYEPDKFGVAKLTPMESLCVKPPRVAECPVEMEAMVREFRSFGKNVNPNTFEVHIVKLHFDESLLVGDELCPHIDPVRWRPLIVNFCRFFGLTGEVHPSRLAESNFMRLASKGGTPRQTSVRLLLNDATGNWSMRR
jgi:flavin reductase (DIM6/NTAB) family NADH-FMN oxidoreductase RutF